MSRLVGKPTMWFPNRSDTNRPLQAQKTARSMKFRIKELEGLYYPCCENKGADQLRGYLICAFVFAYADCWFFQEVAHMFCDIMYTVLCGRKSRFLNFVWFILSNSLSTDLFSEKFLYMYRYYTCIR